MENKGDVDSTRRAVLWLDIEIDDRAAFEGAKKLLKHLRATWQEDDIHFKFFTEGYSNCLLACMRKDDVDTKKDVILVRIYGRGTEQFIDREKERINMMLFNSIGSAAQLYCCFKNGIAYGYTPGTVVDHQLVQDITIQRMVTRELARIQSIDPSKMSALLGDGIISEPQPVLFDSLYHWIKLMPESYEDPDKQAKYDAMPMSREALLAEIGLLRDTLPKLDTPVVLCHNDLLFGNIIYDTRQKKVTFIDFEYAAFNYQAYDIANHFCEFADMDSLDFSRYPSKEYQMTWLRMFLEAYSEENGKLAKDVKDLDVERLYVKVNKFSLCAHLYWSLWAFVQAKNSIINYDYLEFAYHRLSEYLRRKDEFLALKLPC